MFRSAEQIGRNQNLPGLDGLRGTAILAVLLCHYSALLPTTHGIAGLLENGWAGVDLFFVLSGFLITGILVDAKGTPHYFRNFYARRMLRICPLYYGFLATILLLLGILRFRSVWNDGLQSLWRAQPWLWSYTANFWAARQTAWSPWTEMILPLWTLSIEEQFYLIWPILIFSISNRNMIRVCLAILIAAPCARVLLTAGGVHWFTLYLCTFTRIDSLAAGSLLALIVRLPDGRQLARKLCNSAGAIAGLLILGFSHGFDPIHHPWLRCVFYSFLAVFFAALVFWAIDAGSLRGIGKRFYELRILRTVGRYSYGIYVVHLPFMYLIRWVLVKWGLFDAERPTWRSGFVVVAVSLTLTCLAAFVSFHAWEDRFLRMKRYFPKS